MKKLFKISAIVFAITLVLAGIGANAEVYKTFIDLTIKRSSGATKLYTANKQNYGQQSMFKTGAHDDLSNDGRAMQGRIDNYKWVDLPEDKVIKYDVEITYFAADNYSHYVKAKKSTLSTVSYWGSWYWDMQP